MSILYERMQTSDATTKGGGTYWRAQTFTPVTTHSITAVRLWLRRLEAAPGTFAVGITAIDGSGHPTGADLAAGSIDGATVTDDVAGAWYEFTISTPTTLTAGTTYAIVLSNPTGTNNNAFRIFNQSDSAYTVGNAEGSTDSGATWSSLVGSGINDFAFEEWGNPIYVAQVANRGASHYRIVKEDDETVNNSTTLQNDDELLFEVDRDQVWEFRIHLYTDATATADIKIGVTVPSGAVVGFKAFDATTTDYGAGTTGSVSLVGAASNTFILVIGHVIVGATGGNVTLQWAQDTGTVEDTKVLANSMLIADRIG